MNKSELYPKPKEINEVYLNGYLHKVGAGKQGAGHKAIAKFAVDNAVKRIVEQIEKFRIYDDEETDAYGVIIQITKGQWRAIKSLTK